MMEIHTDRLILRQWQESDILPFIEMNADPRVMKFFPNIFTREEVLSAIKRYSDQIEKNGWGPWAAIRKDTGKFIGYIGLQAVSFNASFTPAVEVGWRLCFDEWKQGFATEGAKAAMKFGFEKLNLLEIVSLTVPANLRSRRVMEKLGMTHDPKDNFEHPRLPEGHSLRPHVLYRIKKEKYFELYA